MRGRGAWRPRRAEVAPPKTRGGLYEALRVQRHTAVEPVGAGRGARHDEDVLDVVSLDWTVIRPPMDTLEMAVSIEGRNLRARSQRDRRILFDPPNQVPRH